MYSHLLANYARLQERIDKVSRRCGRDPHSVRLMAVSKFRPISAIQILADAGFLLFGENRVQEAAEKIPLLKTAGLEWHMIGHLQSNKVKQAVELFHMIQSIDSLALAVEVDRRLPVYRNAIPVLLQINIGHEPQKSGFTPQTLLPLLPALAKLTRLRIAGLMAIPPQAGDAQASRGYFRQLAVLASQILSEKIPGIAMDELSMGMSHDFEIAIEEGATLVRVGSALFEANG